MQFQGESRLARGIREICENRSVPRHFLTILPGFVHLTLLGPISMHAISLRLAQHLIGRLYYFGSIIDLM